MNNVTHLPDNQDDRIPPFTSTSPNLYASTVIYFNSIYFQNYKILLIHGLSVNLLLPLYLVTSLLFISSYISTFHLGSFSFYLKYIF